MTVHGRFNQSFEAGKTVLKRGVKAAYYVLAGPMMKLNGVLLRHLNPRSGAVMKVHLGPGQKKYIDGWINVDANIFTAKIDIWADLRNPLPFKDAAVDAVYSHHMVEHLPNMAAHFRDVYRCLKPGGIYRVAGPNGDNAIKKYLSNQPEWFPDYPDKRSSLGGKLENFIFCHQEHLTMLTYSFLEELMTAAGFSELKVCAPVRETYYPELFKECLEKEHESDFDAPHTLVVEAKKPSSADRPL